MPVVVSEVRSLSLSKGPNPGAGRFDKLSDRHLSREAQYRMIPGEFR
ncbi:hypothetical protein [Microbacterium sp. NIBRBAC000506063]|nr:hypothetical protein [Microbacterium sp. NIBRBAC000506063]QTV80381.1 hypothetical protein KAE78_05450 [Microbacterium sp. NIBRBAC000506063]